VLAEDDKFAKFLSGPYAWQYYPYAGPAWYVSAAASTPGNGSISDPWPLTTALSSTQIQSGQTVYLRGGVYSAGALTVTRPGVTFKAYPGEVVKLDGSIAVNAAGCTFEGLEIYSSAWATRATAQTGSTPSDITVGRGFTINSGGVNTTIKSCVIHDTREGILTSADGLTVQDCLFYNNGWTAPDRGHGHSIYINNTMAPATIERCVFVGDYDGWGIHAYAEGNAVSHIAARDNVSIGKIMLFRTPGTMDDITAERNEVWRAKLEVGQASKDRFGITIADNYLVGAGAWYPLVTRRLKQTVVRGNTLITDTSYALDYTTPNTDPPISIDWDANTYWQSSGTCVNDNGTPRAFAAWQGARGLDANSTYAATLPTTNRIRTITRADGTAIVVIYNWQGLASVAAPLSGTYQNVLNPAESITLTQDDALPMTGWTVATPIGDTAPVMTSTFPQFGCFVVTP
jgi:hypothetical protein